MYYCEDSFKQFLLNEASDYIRLQERALLTYSLVMYIQESSVIWHFINGISEHSMQNLILLRPPYQMT